MLALFTFLHRYDHEYIIYYDTFHRSYGDKLFSQSLACVERWMTYLKSRWAEVVILPPIYELHFLASDSKPKAWSVKILPLFTTYVMHSCFAYSLIWKIGLVWDSADIEVAQPFMERLAATYKLSDTQTSIKRFHFPFSFRTKDVSMRKYYLTWFPYSHVLVNRIIKMDLRYFKDAMVDTLIPLNYWFFRYQRTISKFFNFKHIRFHPLHELEQAFVSLHLEASPSYAINIACTWNDAFLLRDKKLLRELQKGKTIPLSREKL